MCESPNIPLYHPAAEMGTLAAFLAPNSWTERIWEVEAMPEDLGKMRGRKERERKLS